MRKRKLENVENTEAIPAMPCEPYTPVHRMKHPDQSMPFPACVARPVGKQEIEAKDSEGNYLHPKAHSARKAEWERLWKKGVWDVEQIRDWDEIAREARASGKEVNMGRLFGIMVEKGSELQSDDPRRKYKYRVVFQGNNVVNQNWEAALFQNLGSSPATMEAGKVADFMGCLKGNTTQQADAEQAYVQADLQGTETWVWLPPEAWQEAPDWIKKRFKHMYEDSSVPTSEGEGGGQETATPALSPYCYGEQSFAETGGVSSDCCGEQEFAAAGGVEDENPAAASRKSRYLGAKRVRLVVRLLKALYGHPDAGTHWEQHCETVCVDS